MNYPRQRRAGKVQSLVLLNLGLASTPGTIVYPRGPGLDTPERESVYVPQCSLRLEVGLNPVAPHATTSTSRPDVKVTSARRNDRWDLLLTPFGLVSI